MRFDSIRSHSTAGPLDECAKFANDFPGQPEHGLTVGARDKLMPFVSDQKRCQEPFTTLLSSASAKTPFLVPKLLLGNARLRSSASHLVAARDGKQSFLTCVPKQSLGTRNSKRCQEPFTTLKDPWHLF